MYFVNLSLMDNDTIRSAVLEVLEVSLTAQIHAIRSLRAGKRRPNTQDHENGSSSRPKRRSQLDLTHDILAEAAQPLHVTDIISRIAGRFDVSVDRESLVSALSKRVARQDRFKRTNKNTFALIENNTPKAPRP